MLTDRQLERYSRQILLPDVGGRGQERLLAATVVLAGTGDALAVAATLLARAGVGRLVSTAAGVPAGTDGAIEGDATLDLAGVTQPVRAPAMLARPVVVGRYTATTAVLATLVGRPCLHCLPAATLAPPSGSDDGPLAAALPPLLGGLGASEILRTLLAPPARGRVHRVALEAGTVTASELAPGGCARCAGSA